jgi:hypothetical protein
MNTTHAQDHGHDHGDHKVPSDRLRDISRVIAVRSIPIFEISLHLVEIEGTE